jgi:hypothetical protein
MQSSAKRLVVCVANEGNEESLVRHRIYVQIPDAEGAKHGMVRVIDEDDEDYLFPEAFFVPLDLSNAASKLLGPAGAGLVGPIGSR